MSYLSRRMREDGWPRRELDDLTITLTFDFAERIGLALTPWQKVMVEAMYAAPPDGWLWEWRHRSTHTPMLAVTTPGESSSLAGLVAKVREAGEQAPVWEWPDEEPEYWPRQNGKAMRFNREYLGVWPSERRPR